MNKEKTFNDFNLDKDIMNSIKRKGFDKPSEIQEKTIPIVLQRAKDIVAIAQTGTGKTAAFGLPLVHLIKGKSKNPKAIILAPTRELALQVTKELKSYSFKKRLNITTIYGGASLTNQSKDLRRGVDIVVGTPGRVVDMLKRRILNLKEIDYFILDEADEMLNMGFIDDIEYTLSEANNKKRVYLFSATMPKRIKDLSKKYMKKQEIIEVKPEKSIHTELIEQKYYKVERPQKNKLLMKIIDKERFFYGIVFCKMKSEVDKLTRELKREKYPADCIHGDITQNKRERVLQKFRDQKISILIATDVAARGIDINNLTHVVNHSLPQAIETYVHRIGRTGRAGNKGVAITFVPTADIKRLKLLEKLTGFKLKEEKWPFSKENNFKSKREENKRPEKGKNNQKFEKRKPKREKKKEPFYKNKKNWKKKK